MSFLNPGGEHEEDPVMEMAGKILVHTGGWLQMSGGGSWCEKGPQLRLTKEGERGYEWSQKQVTGSQHGIKD